MNQGDWLATKNRIVNKLLLAVSLLLSAHLSTIAQEQQNVSLSESELSILRHLPSWTFTTKAYQREAVRLMLEEANRVAKELSLPEQIPITESNLTEVYISPPALVRLGRISTSNYVYYASVGRTFSGLEQAIQAETWGRILAEHRWPIGRMDTNRAFQAATQIMSAVGMDVAALNRDCRVEIHVALPEGPRGKYFIPDYVVHWKKPGSLGAHVEYFEPTKSIHQLHVWDAKYILRKPMQVPNLAELLDQTNASPQTNVPAKPPE
jgi:hypothetical protein